MRTKQARLHFPMLPVLPELSLCPHPHPHPPTHTPTCVASTPPPQVRRVGLDQTLLEVSGTLEVFPRRTILLPATLLLPEVVPIRATLQIGVEGPLEVGAVELVVAKWVSEPDWPAVSTVCCGWFCGGVAAALFLVTRNLGAWSSALL